MDLKRKPGGDKVYRGAYSYYRGETKYAEEEFEVYKDRKEMGITFFATLHSRVSTGELLTVYMDYTLTKDYIPSKLLLEKSLGKEFVQEVFDFNQRNNTLDYLFISSEGQEHQKISAPPKFSITTPCACTSMLFLRSKKEDTTSKNYYQVISSTNSWKYETLPFQQTIVAERISLSSESVNIEGQSVQATPYKIFDADELENTEDQSSVTHTIIQLSKHSSIPYMLRSNHEGIKIQIKYLNDLDKD